MDTLRVMQHYAAVSKMDDTQIEREQAIAIERLNMRQGNADFTRAIMSFLGALQVEQEARALIAEGDAG